jgi:TetR/AcrR family transcriptional repressor of nem operon
MRASVASRSAGPGTAERILDVAQRLAQTRGFNGFSYANIAPELGITKASLHYHFPTKAELGRALIARYTDAFEAALDAAEASESSAPGRLARYATLYADTLDAERMCLCGMLAAEYTTLPAAMQNEIRRFFERNEEWLARVLEDGLRQQTLAFAGTARDQARLLLAGLEGSMLLARSYGDRERFATAAAGLLGALAPSTAAAAAAVEPGAAPRHRERSVR